MRNRNRIIVTAMVIVMALLTGCVHIPDMKNQSDNTVNDIGDKTDDRGIPVNDIDYKSSSHELKIEDGAELCYDSFCYYDKCIYYATRVCTGKTEYTYYLNRYTSNDDKTSVISDFTCEYPVDTGIGNISYIRIVNDKMYVFMYSVNEENSVYGEGDIHIQKRVYSLTGDELAIIELENDMHIDSGCVCYIDGADNTYIYCGSNGENQKGLLIMYDANGKIVNSMQAGSIFGGNVMLTNGDFVASEKNNPEQGGFTLYNVSGKSADKSCFTQLNEEAPNMNLIAGYGDEIYLNGSYNCIFSYNMKTGELLNVIDGNTYSIDTLNMMYFARTDEDAYICVADGVANGAAAQIVELVRTDGPVEDRQVIRIAAKGITDMELKEVTDSYNRQNDSVRIDYVVYNDDDSGYEYEKDMAAGLIPDIYIVNGFNEKDLISKGLLEELSPYMKKDDVLTEDYFIDGFTDALKVNGKLYYITRDFCLDSLCCYGSEAELIDKPFNISTLTKYYESKPGNTLLADSLYGRRLFQKFYICNEERFINRENGECDFANDDFRNLLKLCSVTEKRYADVYNDNYDNNDEYVKRIRERKTLFSDREIRGLYDIQNNDILFEGDACYVGYPSENDEGRTLLKPYGSTFAISSASEHKEEAWKIIKELMTGTYNKYDHDFLSGMYIPSSKEEYGLYVNDCKCDTDYIAKDGKEVHYAVPGSVCGTDMKPCGSEELSVLDKLMSNARYCSDSGDYYAEMPEDVNGYTTGSKDMETTIDIISDRMSKYINEK